MELVIEALAFINTWPHGLLILDEDSNILLANRAMEAFTGYSEAHLREMNVKQLIPEQVAHPHNGKLSEIIKDGTRSMKPLSDVPLLRADGEVVQINVERSVYSYSNGTRRFAGIITPARGE